MGRFNLIPNGSEQLAAYIMTGSPEVDVDAIEKDATAFIDNQASLARHSTLVTAFSHLTSAGAGYFTVSYTVNLASTFIPNYTYAAATAILLGIFPWQCKLPRLWRTPRPW